MFYAYRNIEYGALEILEYLRDADVWSHLDSIIIHPTGSRLQRVDIDIIYFPCGDDTGSGLGFDSNEFLETVFDVLPLLRKAGILFVKTSVGK